MNTINKLEFYQKNNIQPMNLTGGISINEGVGNTSSFKDTMANMINEMNEITKQPEQLTQDAIQGKADIHDVMAAIAKSELTVQTATTVTGKILQTYEKIMQIQI